MSRPLNPHEARCINQGCYLRMECALFVKDRRLHEQLFAGTVYAGGCDYFVNLRSDWGDGPEEEE